LLQLLIGLLKNLVESDDMAGYWLSVCGHNKMTARNTRH